MSRIQSATMVIGVVGHASLAGSAFSVPDKYTVQVPDGLAFSEFKGFAAVFATTATFAEEPKSSANLTLYKTADAAACTGDATVWLDPVAHIYYLRGERFFGKTKTGGYNCRKQADAAGYHPSKSR